MDLEQYLKKHKIKQTEFAQQLGVTPTCISRWIRKIRLPRLAMMKKIITLTGGKVTAADFYRED